MRKSFYFVGYSILLSSLGLYTIACTTSSTSQPVQQKPVTINVVNTSSYPVSMSIDGGAAAAITVSGYNISHTFIINPSPGNHTFAATSSAAQYPSTCPGSTLSLNSTLYIGGTFHTLNINNDSGTLNCSGTNYNFIIWQPPQ